MKLKVLTAYTPEDLEEKFRDFYGSDKKTIHNVNFNTVLVKGSERIAGYGDNAVYGGEEILYSMIIIYS